MLVKVTKGDITIDAGSGTEKTFAAGDAVVEMPAPVVSAHPDNFAVLSPEEIRTYQEQVAKDSALQAATAANADVEKAQQAVKAAEEAKDQAALTRAQNQLAIAQATAQQAAADAAPYTKKAEEHPDAKKDEPKAASHS